MCKSSKSVNVVTEFKDSPTHNSDKDDNVFLYSIINKVHNDKEIAHITLEVNNSLSIKFKVDTGAQAKILPAKYSDALLHKLPPTKSTRDSQVTVDKKNPCQRYVPA